MNDITIVPLTADRLGDLADLFSTNTATRGCHCTFFLTTRRDTHAGWHNGQNRARFEAVAKKADPPMGLLAYRGGRAIGWCALGPRTRYPVAIGPRAKIMAGRDPAEDDDVWFVPCFFVRVGERRSGVTHALLNAAVELANRSGAKAIEGFPTAGDQRNADEFLGREKLFAACGFECIARPSPRRAVMRREFFAKAKGRRR